MGGPGEVRLAAVTASSACACGRRAERSTLERWGTARPSRENEAAFARAVDEVAESTRTLLARLTTHAPPRDREQWARKARERSRRRFGGV